MTKRSSDQGEAGDAGKAGRVLETHARLAIEAAGLGLWEWEVAEDYFTVDATVAGLLGRPELADAPFKSEKMTDLTHPDDRDLVSHTIQNLLESDISSSSLEHRIIKPSGEQRWLSIKASVVKRGAAGTPETVAGVVQDLTERKQAELDLRAEKRRYDLATTGSLIAIWEWEAHTGRTSWSPRACEMLGIDPSISSGDRALLVDWAHPDDLERVRQALFDHIDTGTPFDSEFRMRHSDGHYITVRSRGQSEYDDQGQLVRMAGSMIDITAERKAEIAAQRAGMRTQLALEAAGLGTWDFDTRTKSIVMDQPLADLIGRPGLGGWEVSREQMYSLTAPEDIERVRPRMAALAKGEVDYVRDEYRIVHADGRRIWILAHVGVAERDGEGRPTRLVGVVQDLTERKRAEAALRHAKERAEAASEAKSNFIATMSHEIRTPLNGVLGVAQLLSLSQLDERQRTYVDTLMSSGKMLAGVIDDVLDISRIEAGKLKLVRKPVRIAQWLHETVESHASAAREKGLAFKIVTEAHDDHIAQIDPQRMAQVVGNLVSNAVKFTEAGGVEIRLSLAGRDRLRIEVADDGPGIDAQMQAAIFNRFTQADMSPSRQHGGSGLGLAIARELAALAGGQVGVVSAPGEGSTFWVEIPAPNGEEERLPGSQSRALRAIEPGLKILIVEDHAINRDMLGDMMRQSGFSVEMAASGEAALEMLADRRFDAVLLDLHMPGIGGHETLRRIRDGETGARDIPVFLITADATPQARDLGAEFGADGFFTKPVDMGAVVDALISTTPQERSPRSKA